MYRLIVFSLLFPLLFSACQNRPSPIPVHEPLWMAKPSLEGKIGAVGSAKPHFKGPAEQRKLAISRALDELAQQSGVEVKSAIVRNEKRTGSLVNSSAELFTLQNSTNETIKAHIQEIWTNPKTKEMHVWLLAD